MATPQSSPNKMIDSPETCFISLEDWILRENAWHDGFIVGKKRFFHATHRFGMVLEHAVCRLPRFSLPNSHLPYLGPVRSISVYVRAIPGFFPENRYSCRDSLILSGFINVHERVQKAIDNAAPSGSSPLALDFADDQPRADRERQTTEAWKIDELVVTTVHHGAFQNCLDRVVIRPKGAIKRAVGSRSSRRRRVSRETNAFFLAMDTRFLQLMSKTKMKCEQGTRYSYDLKVSQGGKVYRYLVYRVCDYRLISFSQCI